MIARRKTRIDGRRRRDRPRQLTIIQRRNTGSSVSGLRGRVASRGKLTARSSVLTTYLNFLRAGLLKHGQTGGIMPSQRFLIAKMIAPLPKAYRGKIIELGAGAGALTLRLAARCPNARILACEINPILARDNRRNLAAAELDGRVEVRADSAERLLRELGRGGIRKPDYIISGIPLGNLGKKKAGALLDTIRRTLGDRGMYIQFQHSLLDRKKIRARFPKVRTTLVLLNFPPAFVYYARKKEKISSER
jgi:phosphatidylethanolamine/phosphatidyl-N-methylethanolamine N-methyltransferase